MMPPRSNQPIRVIRREPLMQRLQSIFSLADNYLWISEEFNSQDWEAFDKNWGIILAVSLNIVFIVGRASSSITTSDSKVFEDDYSNGNGLVSFLWSCLTTTLIVFSVINALYAFLRTKSYRLFHADINQRPKSTSARRVKVDSSPTTSSPLRFLTNIISNEENLENADQTQIVWEVSIWEPIPICLRLAVLFSPGNVFIVSCLLPCLPNDLNKMSALVYAFGLCFLLSGQGYILQKLYSQQSKDTLNIYSQVSKEYDEKYVHPNVQKKFVRDSAIQALSTEYDIPEVMLTKPYQSPKGFHTRPNQTYASHYDRYNELDNRQGESKLNMFITPQGQSRSFQYSSAPVFPADLSSPIKPTLQNNQGNRSDISSDRPRYSSTGSGTGPGDGGYLGVYTHAASPLRKAASANLLRQGGSNGVRKRDSALQNRSSFR